jgi:hypothetical protein
MAGEHGDRSRTENGGGVYDPRREDINIIRQPLSLGPGKVKPFSTSTYHEISEYNSEISSIEGLPCGDDMEIFRVFHLLIY